MPSRVTVRHLQHSIHWASDKICRTLSVRLTFSILFPPFQAHRDLQDLLARQYFSRRYETQAPEHRQVSEVVRTPSKQTSKVLQVPSGTLTTELGHVCGKHWPEQDKNYCDTPGIYLQDSGMSVLWVTLSRSANIDERSQRRDRNSELTAVIREADMIDSY
jgi:hypothetical protein